MFRVFCFCLSLLLGGMVLSAGPNGKIPSELEPLLASNASALKSPSIYVEDRAFLRRIWLDLVGRLPSPQHVASFLADTSSIKYAAEIDLILNSEAFTTRWTTFFADMFKNYALLENSALYRNAFDQRLRQMVAAKMPLDQMAREILTAGGEGKLPQTAMFFWAKEAFEEAERMDYLDDQAGWIADVFLGVEANCISCHDGAGRLGTINKGLAQMTRKQFWGMAAFLSSTYLYQVDEVDDSEANELNFFKSLRLGDRDGQGIIGPDPDIYLSFADDSGVEPVARLYDGQYHADTRPGQGMRPPRRGGVIQPAYPFSGEGPGPGESRRQALARILTADRQFSRNMVNRIWAHLFGEGFVEPHNGWDLARVDASIAQTNGLTVQPKNSLLLEFLTDWFIQNNFDTRGLIRLLVNSKVYQWDYINTREGEGSIAPGDRWGYWRDNKRVRRLEAEAIVDSYYQVLGITPQFLVLGLPGKLHTSTWQLPDPSEPSYSAIFGPEDDESQIDEPTSIAGVLVEELIFDLELSQDLLTAFGRGQYFTGKPRTSDVSIQNSLVLLNGELATFWLEEPEASPMIMQFSDAYGQGQLAGSTLIRDLFLHILFRVPSPEETAALMPHLAGKSPQRAVTDLFWVLLNHPDFIFK